MESSGFFTAELQSDGTYDRVYVAEEFAKYFSLFVGTGVFVQPASQLMVTQADTASMKVKVKAGNAFINGYWYNNSSALQFDVPNANGALDRWDAIMVRHDFIGREARLSYVTGTPAITPSKPQPERTQDAYEICLAHIFVGRGVLKIVDANITDTRPDSSLCGYVKGLVETVNTTDLFAQFRSAFNQFFESGSSEYNSFVESVKTQYDSTVSEYFTKYNTLYLNNQASFNSWFEDIKGKLGDDIAGSLQNQVTALDTKVTAMYSKFATVNFEVDFTIPTTFSTTAPYEATVTVAGVKATDQPMVAPVYSSDVTTAIAQKKAWSCVDEIVTQDGKVVVRCFSKVPTVTIPVHMKGVRI